MPGRKRERDSPASRSASVEPKAGKRQTPRPLFTPGWSFREPSTKRTIRKSDLRITRFCHLTSAGKGSLGSRNGRAILRTFALRGSMTRCKKALSTGFTVFTSLPRSTNMTLQFLWGVSVEARIHKSPSGNDWKELYKAAIFEDDSVKLGARIAEAERALADRAAELCGSHETPAREQQAMENAAYFLRLLRKTNATLSTSYEPPSPPQISSQQLCG